MSIITQAPSTHAPLHPILQSEIWELPAVHQMLAALDECHLARQQNLLAVGGEQQRAYLLLQNAEYQLCLAKATLLKTLEALPGDEDRCLIGIILDLEAAWESNLSLAAVPPTPQGYYLL